MTGESTHFAPARQALSCFMTPHLVDEEIKVQGDLGNGKVTKVEEKSKAENNPHPPIHTQMRERERI